MSDPRLGRVTVWTSTGGEHVFERAYTTWSEDNCLMVTDGHGQFLAGFSVSGWRGSNTSYQHALEVDNEA